MAPNQKRTQLHLTTLNVDLLAPVKAGFPPLTSEVSQPVFPQQQQCESSDYWNWSSESDAEINQIIDEERLSADRIVDNILSQPVVARVVTCASNDQYWDWSHAKTESTDYWTWESPSEQQVQTPVDSDTYWTW